MSNAAAAAKAFGHDGALRRGASRSDGGGSVSGPSSFAAQVADEDAKAMRLPRSVIAANLEAADTHKRTSAT